MDNNSCDAEPLEKLQFSTQGILRHDSNSTIKSSN